MATTLAVHRPRIHAFAQRKASDSFYESKVAKKQFALGKIRHKPPGGVKAGATLMVTFTNQIPRRQRVQFVELDATGDIPCRTSVRQVNGSTSFV
jgi:hypothetical protein